MKTLDLASNGNAATEEVNMTKPEGRHAEIVPGDGSHYVLVDGQQWSRHDCLATAEAVRQAIVDRWARHYDDRALEIS